MVAAALPEADEIIGGPGVSNADALLIETLLRQIRREQGHQSSEDLFSEVIERSRPTKSPTHHLFEWDPRKGHKMYLLERARRLVMAVRVVFVERPKESPVRAHPVVVTSGKKGPMPLREVLKSSDLTAALLEQAHADLERFQRRYAQLERLAAMRPVFTAIKKTLKQRKG